MVIKEITPLRKQEFKRNISGIISHLKELQKLGVHETEVFDFFYRWLHNEDIFTAKFYRNKEDTNFTYESNFPNHFEYFKIFITEAQASETDENSTNNEIAEKPTENNSSEFVKTKKPKLKLDKMKPQKKKKKTKT